MFKELYIIFYFYFLFSFAVVCADIGMDPLQTIRFQGSLNKYIRCKEPELAKSVYKKRHMIKRIVENSSDHYLKQVLMKSGLLPFHEKFMQEGFTSFQDFFCLSDKKLVNFSLFNQLII